MSCAAPDPGRTDGAIAFVCAMPMELTPLVRRLSLVETTARDGSPVWSGTLGGQPVLAVVTGMGTGLATRVTTALLDGAEPAVRRVVVVGITGALGEGTPIGALIVPEVVIHGATGRRFTPDRLGPWSPSGAMWTSDGLTTDPAELARLRQAGVVALDMETAAVAEVCEQRHIPWSVFRVISDRANDGSVDEEIFGLSHQDGTPDTQALDAYLAAHPERLEHLVELGRQAERATEAAAEAAVTACRSLA